MTRRYYVAAMLLIVVTLAATLIAYPHLPAVVPSHWTLRGTPNRYSAKDRLFMGPALMAGLLVLFRLLPWLSPKHWDLESFRTTYLYLTLVVVGMVGCLHLLGVWVALGHHVQMGQVTVGVLCVMFALAGNVLGKVRRNFYIGVRTPWSLANDRVWHATHRLAAKTFVLCAGVGLALTALGVEAPVTFAVLLAGVMIPVVYSLIVYKQLERAGLL